MTEIQTGADGPSVTVTAVLAHAPVFWTPQYWQPSAQQWDGVMPETPLADRPVAVLQVGIDSTLREVWSAACDAWDIHEGPDQIARGRTREREFRRVAFVDEQRDAQGADVYSWGNQLNVARADGTVEKADAFDLTYRELLVASELDLIDGDITRPYVTPVIPQGDVGLLIEAARLTVEVIRAAYNMLPQETARFVHLVSTTAPEAKKVYDEVSDEVGRPFTWYGLWELSRRLKNRIKRPRHDRRPPDES